MSSYQIHTSRRLTEEMFMAALMDDHTNTIGVFGVRGVGETRLGRQIGEEVKRKKMFNVVMMVRVGPNPDPVMIASNIYGSLTVRFEGGDVVAKTTQLLSELAKQERVLIIVEDVWEFIDLERAGIPKGSCKIIIMSRFTKVCVEMGCNVIFRMQREDDDDVLREESGSSNGSLLQPTATSVACKHIPVPPGIVILHDSISGTVRTSKRWFDRNHNSPLLKLQVLDVKSGRIQVVPGEKIIVRNLRLLNLTNCCNLQTIESGLISNLVCLEELYMLGSFNDWDWEVEKEGRRGGNGNASINELELLSNLRALQIETRDPSIIPKSSRIWSRLTSYVISAPEELKCRYEESPYVSFPAVEIEYPRKILNLDLPSVSTTCLRDWMCVMLGSARYLGLNGDGSKNTVNELILNGGFKLLKQLHIGHCGSMEYLVDGVPTNGFLQSLESLRLDNLPLFKEMFNSRFQVQELFPFLNLRSFHISHCPKLLSLFSLSMAWNFMQLEEITIESCEMMEAIFSNQGGGEISNRIDFCKLFSLKLHNLPHLTHFCKNKSVNFPRTSFRSVQNSDCSNDIQSLFSDKVEFGSLQKLELSKLRSVNSISCHLTSPSLFKELEVLVVTSCNTLRHLISHSIAKVLERLEHLTIEDCFMMHEVIADDGEAEIVEESLFPRLRKLKLLRLPSLKIFCHMTNDLELPSLEIFTVKDCKGMKEFSGGKFKMPVLRCVEDSIQHLFNDKDKNLILHHSFPSPSKCQGQDHMTEPIISHSQRSSQASGGNRGENLLDDKESEKLGEKIGRGDASVSSYGTSSRGQMNTKAKSVLKDFILFCSVLPVYYEFTKDILVCQWMVGELIELGEDKMTEEVCRGYFDTLVDMNYFVRSGVDNVFGQTKYRIGDRITTFLQKHPLEHKFGKYCDSCRTEEVQHLSLTFKDISRMKLEVLKQYRGLQTLVICDSYTVNCLPCDIFSELKTLKILNLSGTNIVDLPSSIEYLKELRFLDMSRTPINRVPGNIDSFSHLQTLNLIDCSGIAFLPECTYKLIFLQHLFLNARQLHSMPVGIGKLTNLETLNAFVVGVDFSHSVRELRDMNKLKGSLSLSHLENVQCKGDALDACLYKKANLKKIVLEWRNIQNKKNPSEEEILESLQPPTSIQELKIMFYMGGMLPSWISNPSFTELERITLYECKYCWSLPSLGELPSLKVLSIIKNVEVVEIDNSFFRKQTNKSRVAFSKLEKLSFESMSKLEKWIGLENGDFPSLRHVIIEYCPKFIGIGFLSRLNSLLELEIRYCPEFSCLPMDGPPPSLKSLRIKKTPKLKSQFCDKEWEGWSKIARVPTISID